MIFRVLFIFGLLSAQNNYPIVLIHGFMGWGSDEMGDYNYWGGKKDFIKSLESQGHLVFELSLGPVSSNWERAIEAYYQLKGGQVDYGKAHSEKYNLIQRPRGKSYDGLYKNWDQDHPIHIIAHSMGGQTARMLQFLLTNVIFFDESADLKEKSILLGGQQNNMIKSITSISTPHNGTTLAEIVTKTVPFIQYFVGLAGVVGTDFYDFDLDQWGFLRKNNEGWLNYMNRMRTHKAWGTKNISSWELGLDGSKELNAFLQASPEVFYFSFVTSTTNKKEGSFFHHPVDETSILIKTRSKIIGSRAGYWSDGEQTDSSWFENDGIVNSVSMYGPSTGINGPDPIVQYEETELLIPGQWYWTKILEMDHWSIIGHLGDNRRITQAEEILIKHAEKLRSLPMNE